jgi:hypothetical protein
MAARRVLPQGTPRGPPLEHGAVGGGDGPDDRQAEAMAVAVAVAVVGAAGIEPLNSWSTLSGEITGPVLATDRTARPRLGAGGYPGRIDRQQGHALVAPHSELTTASRFRE